MGQPAPANSGQTIDPHAKIGRGSGDQNRRLSR
jgi:hypothetical protein